jgi:hypothetical protein
MYTESKMNNIQFDIIELPLVKDIDLFYKKGEDRKKNDANNKVRENIIENIRLFDKTYYEDPEYGEKWRNFKFKLKNGFESLCVVPFYRYKVIKMAGRKYNYDFEVTFWDEHNIEVLKCNIEFKYGASSIDKLPQFLSLNGNFSMIQDCTTYAEFYYDEGYVGKYCEIDTGIILDKPLREEYLKHIINVNYDCHPFFRMLYNQESVYKKEKFKIVNESIEEYLTKYGYMIDTNNLKMKLDQTQQNKIYLLWNKGEFNIETISHDSIVFKEVRKKNEIVLESEHYRYHLLLRWRNHKGILNPAWQISVKHK